MLEMIFECLNKLQQLTILCEVLDDNTGLIPSNEPKVIEQMNRLDTLHSMMADIVNNTHKVLLDIEESYLKSIRE